MGRVFKLGDGVSTDAIIPGRYNVTTDLAALGKACLIEARPDFATAVQPGDVIVAGRNFGCGSSREHAPQSLYYFGIRAILAEGFAEIFFGNSTTLGIPCVKLSPADRQAIAGAIQQRPEQEIDIDLTTAKPTIRCADLVVHGEMPESTRKGLVEGEWDALGQLLDGRDAVARLAKRLAGAIKAA